VKNLSDNQLFEKLCSEGSFSAYKELFDRYWLKLYSAAKVRLQDEDEAKDCVQDVFLNIWSKRESLPMPDSVKAYLLISLKNKILNLLRQKLTTEKHLQNYLEELDHRAESLDPELELHELEAIIEDEVNKMPEQMRKIFILSRDQGLSGAQIAEQLSISHQTVRNQISNSLKRLRQRLLRFRL
jgi:RNA polymerase sigma-70 factor (family 1)